MSSPATLATGGRRGKSAAVFSGSEAVVSGHLADLWKFAGFDDLLGHKVAVVEHSPQFRLDEPASEKITQLAQGWKIVDFVTKDRFSLAIVEEKMR